MEWQSIDTAPKDGTEVILFGTWAGEIAGVQSVKRADIGCWDKGTSDYLGNDWWQLSTGDGYACWMRPTHWMPLPAEPKE